MVADVFWWYVEIAVENRYQTSRHTMCFVIGAHDHIVRRKAHPKPDVHCLQTLFTKIVDYLSVSSSLTMSIEVSHSFNFSYNSLMSHIPF